MKSTILKLALAILVFVPFYSNAQKTKLAYGGGNGTDQFHQSLLLSNGHMLIAASGDSLNWLPAGTPVITLDTTSLAKKINTSTTKVGYLLELSANLDTIYRAVAFPKGAVENIYKIRTTTPPGQPTGDLFISGELKDDGNPRVFVAKLNANFVSGIPNSLPVFHIIKNRMVSTGGKHAFDGRPWNNTRQPWDVDSKGNILIGTGHDFDFSWADITGFKPDGFKKYYPGFSFHAVRLKKDAALTAFFNQFNVVSTFSTENHFPEIARPDSLYFDDVKFKMSRPVPGNPNATKDTTITLARKFAIDSVYDSSILLKFWRKGHPTSYDANTFNFVGEDENGNPGRKGTYPTDFYHDTWCNTDDCPISSDFNPGYKGHYAMPSNTISTGRVAEILFDKRNNDIYYAITFMVNDLSGKSAVQTGSQIVNYETALVKLDSNGYIKWFSRMYKEDSLTAAGNFVDDIVLDYKSNEVVALCRSLDNFDNNFWDGNKLKYNPGGQGFRNNLNVASGSVAWYGWLGKFRMADGKIMRSTYMGDLLANATGTDTLLTGNLAGWVDPNKSTSKNGESYGDRVRIMPDGSVAIIGRTLTRAYTTSDAFQGVTPYNGTTSGYPKGSTPEVNSYNGRNGSLFVRVYDRDLSTIKYSSMLAGQWDANGAGGNYTYGEGLAVTADSSLLVTGFQGRMNGQTLTTGGKIPFGSFKAAWSDTAFKGVTAVMAKLPLTYCVSVEQSPMDTMLCEGGSFTLKAQGVAVNNGPVTYKWMKGMDSVGTGSVYSVANATVADTGVYYCVISAGCGTVKTSSAKVSVPAVVNVSQVLGDTAYCYGEVAKIMANMGTFGNTFKWYKNGVLLSGFTSNYWGVGAINGADSGTYKMVVKGFCGFDSISKVIKVNMMDTIPTIITQPMPDTVCRKGAAMFSVVATGKISGYTWFHKGVNIGTGSSVNITPNLATDSGYVYVNVNTPNCGPLKSKMVYLTVKSINTNVNVDPRPEFQSTTLTSLQDGAVYKWLNCATNDSIGADQAIEPRQVGNYKVVIKYNGCVDTSACVQVTIASFNGRVFGGELKVYPNPTNGLVNIDLSGDYRGEVLTQVFDIYGREVDSHRFIKNGSQSVETFDLHTLPTGMYLVRIKAGSEVVNVQMLKN